MPDTPDIPDLLGQLKHTEQAPEAAKLLASFHDEAHKALQWQREAGQALAWEGLQTDVLKERIELWIECGRQRLRTGLCALLEKPPE